MAVRVPRRPEHEGPAWRDPRRRQPCPRRTPLRAKAGPLARAGLPPGSGIARSVPDRPRKATTEWHHRRWRPSPFRCDPDRPSRVPYVTPAPGRHLSGTRGSPRIGPVRRLLGGSLLAVVVLLAVSGPAGAATRAPAKLTGHGTVDGTLGA